MLAEKELERIALFYYFAFLDEAKAHAAATKTIKKLKKLKISPQHDESGAFFVSITQDMAAPPEKRDIKAVGSGLFSGFLNLPEKSNWGPWFEFKKMADQKDYQAVIYSKLLNLSDATIAAGLKVPLGSVRYRIGRGLKVLGAICGGGTARV